MQRLLLSLSVAAAFASAPSAQVSLEFRGGNLNDYIAQLRTAIEAQRDLYTAEPPAYVQFPNILVQGAADRFPVPALELVEVTPDAALKLLERLSSPEDRYGVDVRAVAQATESRGVPIARGLVVVTVGERRRPDPGSSQVVEPVHVEVFTVRDLIEVPLGLGEFSESANLAIPVDDLLVALDVGLGLITGEVEHDIRFHSESGLLFVRGSPEHIRVTGDVIDRVQLPLIMRRRAAQEVLSRRPLKKPESAEPASGSGGEASSGR